MRALFLYAQVDSEGGPSPLLRLKAATQAVAEAVTSLHVGSLLGKATGSSAPMPKYTNNSMMSSQILVIRVSCMLFTEDNPFLTAGPDRIEEWLDGSTTREPRTAQVWTSPRGEGRTLVGATRADGDGES